MVTLTGFQVHQLLALVDHVANRRVYITVDDGRVHARLEDQWEKRYLPASGAEMEELANRGHHPQVIREP